MLCCVVWCVCVCVRTCVYVCVCLSLSLSPSPCSQASHRQAVLPPVVGTLPPPAYSNTHTHRVSAPAVLPMAVPLPALGPSLLRKGVCVCVCVCVTGSE
ncbi:MAG: hypothetical protein P4L40_05045 [Terracidiphilus sp.]|nr:hypothetical protein [Terracidiphilus sp.]